jgi:hypothetical protein
MVTVLTVAEASMAGEIKLGRFAGLSLSAMPSAIIGTLVLWVVLSAIGIALLRVDWPKAIGGGLIAALLHQASEIVHQLGHSWAARQTGYPMTGIRLWGLLSTSVYPPDEPALPATIHIRRALGGPMTSLLVSILAGIFLYALRDRDGVARWIALFFFLDNLLTFTLGSCLPLGFTDGSTLLHWLGKRKAQ